MALVARAHVAAELLRDGVWGSTESVANEVTELMAQEHNGSVVVLATGRSNRNHTVAHVRLGTGLENDLGTTSGRKLESPRGFPEPCERWRKEIEMGWRSTGLSVEQPVPRCIVEQDRLWH